MSNDCVVIIMVTLFIVVGLFTDADVPIGIYGWAKKVFGNDKKDGGKKK